MDRNELLGNMKKIFGCRQMNAEHCFNGCSVCDFYCAKEEREETFKTVIAMLEGKDTNVLTKWIPVSERMPEEGQEILATTVPNGWYDVVIIRSYYAMIHKSVVAWMPLPEPYKEG